MTTHLNFELATAHVADLREAADRRRRASVRLVPSVSTGPPAQRIDLRPAGVADARVIRRLAALDEAPELDGPALLALVDGDAVAALSLRDERVIANPFVSTGEAVALLRLRAEHLAGRRPRRRRRIGLRQPHLA